MGHRKKPSVGGKKLGYLGRAKNDKRQKDRSLARLSWTLVAVMLKLTPSRLISMTEKLRIKKNLASFPQRSAADLPIFIDFMYAQQNKPVHVVLAGSLRRTDIIQRRYRDFLHLRDVPQNFLRYSTGHLALIETGSFHSFPPISASFRDQRAGSGAPRPTETRQLIRPTAPFTRSRAKSPPQPAKQAGFYRSSHTGLAGAARKRHWLTASSGGIFWFKPTSAPGRSDRRRASPALRENLVRSTRAEDPIREATRRWAGGRRGTYFGFLSSPGRRQQ